VRKWPQGPEPREAVRPSERESVQNDAIVADRCRASTCDRCPVTLRIIATLVALSCTTAHAEPVVEQRRTTRLLAITAGGLVYAASELLVKDELAPDRCRWCTPPGIDESVRNSLVWDRAGRAGLISNFTGYAALPAVSGALLVLASNDVSDARALRLVDDAIPIAEAVVYTQLLTQILKFSVGRQRPFARFATEPFTPANEDNLSFFSGHSSLVFSIAVSSGMVAHRRGYTLEPVIWATGLSLAAATAYLRIAADRHYLTDVLVGSAIGAAGGYLIPRLTGSLPGGISVVPSGNGAAIVGRF